MNFILFVSFAAVLFIVLMIVGAAIDQEWLKFLGLILFCALGLFSLIGTAVRTTNQMVKTAEVETYQLAPLLTYKDGDRISIDDKYVVVDGERVLFSYFAEDSISTSVDVDADYVDFGDANGAMSVTTKIGKLATRREYFSIFFVESEEDCIIYELNVPEDAILFKPSDGKYTQLEEIVETAG